MICYRDMTFCPYHLLCKNGHTCERAMTKEVYEGANRWWGRSGAPIAYYGELPECFVRKFEGGEDENSS